MAPPVSNRLRLADELKEIYRALSGALEDLSFGAPTTHVYNPLVYAREPAERYLERAAEGHGNVVLLGMNPGPWGMVQTGVPFGTVRLVRDWLDIGGRVGKPPLEHPKRPVEGFEVRREEVSGNRLWGWARERFGTPDRFFARFFVANYCPLAFLEATGRNRTPDRLPAAERGELFRLCDRALRHAVRALEPAWVVGIGKFAEDRARNALGDTGVRIGGILHPSPASPVANRGWTQQAERQLSRLGIRLP